MSTKDDISKVKKNILSIYEKRKAAVYALSLQYAAIAINYFRSEQANGRFWSNQTDEAKNRMFSNAFIEDNIVGWFLAHGVFYGVYLELSNDRQNEALRPIIQRYAGRFFNAVKALY